MKNALIGFIFGALLTGGAFLWIPSETPVVTPVCQEQEKIIETTKYVESSCPTLDDSKIEKAFLLFLASIGIKKDYSSDVKSLVNNPESYSPPAREESVVEATPVAEIEIYYPRENFAKTFTANDTFRIATEYDPKLKKSADFVLKDPALYIARSKLIESMRVLRRLNGVYSGKFYRLKGDHIGAVENIELSLEYTFKNRKEIEGNFFMSMERDGNVYNRSRGNGGNNQLYLNPANSDQIIIRAAPETYFHFLDLNLALANVYEKGEYVGVATLTRQ